MNNYNQLTTSLLKAYDTIFSDSGNAPLWAVHKRNYPAELVRPTIPFVGKQYAERPKKILVYASAENLAGYYLGNTEEWYGDWLDDDRQAEHRHRKCFDDPHFQNDSFFPHVHIGPMNNGCLATAVRFVAEKTCTVTTTDPHAFYETIAFGNYSKFSIETEMQKSIRTGKGAVGSSANIDFTQIPVKEAREKLNASVEYLKKDIALLEPDIVILPENLYDRHKKSFDKIVNEIDGHAVLIPIYQINTGVVNRTIARKFARYDINRLSGPMQEWYAQLHQEGMTGTTKENYLSVFTYLDHKLEHSLR